MMEVLKVIVDELPDGCHDCPYMYLGFDGSLICFARPVGEQDNLILSGEFIRPDKIPRQDWCPLEIKTTTERDYELRHMNPYNTEILKELKESK